MTIDDIITKDGINKKFMSWLWSTDRKKYVLVSLGHIELITDDLIKKFEKSGVEK